MYNRLFIIALIVICYSCKEEVFFNQYNALPMEWHKDSVVKFNFQIKDSSLRYNTYINLRIDEEYLFNNIFLIVTLDNSRGSVIIDTLEYQMATNRGDLIGRKFINIVENKLAHKERISFYEDIEYEISISHAMRSINNTEGIEMLKGILDVGYSVEEIRNK
tara:strand:- start:762 stop:1247 length:486 start_codon:yes stop_codon:yes gene_type:complete